MFGMSLTEIAVILIVGLVILGPEKLPEMMRTVGKVLREVRKAGNLLRDTIMIEEQDFNRANANKQAPYQAPALPPANNTQAPPREDLHVYDHGEDPFHEDEFHTNYGLHESKPMEPPTRFEITVSEQRAQDVEGVEVSLNPTTQNNVSVDDAWLAHMDNSEGDTTRKDVPLHVQTPDPGHGMGAW